jgi:hypothetical protein
MRRRGEAGCWHLIALEIHTMATLSTAQVMAGSMVFGEMNEYNTRSWP